MDGKQSPHYHYCWRKRSYTRKFYQATNQSQSPQNLHQNLMKNIHENAIKYLTYMIMNKKKLDNKQTPVSPTIRWRQSSTSLEPTSQRRHNILYCIMGSRDQHRVNGLIFTPVYKYGRYFFFFFS
jgi:hypothetical protein